MVRHLVDATLYLVGGSKFDALPPINIRTIVKCDSSPMMCSGFELGESMHRASHYNDV